jgi:hypothetical protein
MQDTRVQESALPIRPCCHHSQHTSLPSFHPTLRALFHPLANISPPIPLGTRPASTASCMQPRHPHAHPHNKSLVRWEERLGPSRGSSCQYRRAGKQTPDRIHYSVKPPPPSLTLITHSFTPEPPNSTLNIVQPWVTRKGDPSSLWLVPYLLGSPCGILY